MTALASNRNELARRLTRLSRVAGRGLSLSTATPVVERDGAQVVASDRGFQEADGALSAAGGRTV